jgi:hypothetical protein
MKDSRTKIVVN